MAEAVSVTSVEVLGDHKLRVGFSDGLTRVIDLTYLLDRGPIFEPLRDEPFFARVRVDAEAREIVWPNEADVDPFVLHGEFEPAQSKQLT